MYCVVIPKKKPKYISKGLWAFKCSLELANKPVSTIITVAIGKIEIEFIVP